jgi:hypothetical protein
LVNKKEKTMKIFRDYTYTWWQVSIFKISMITMGVIIGSLWAEVFVDFLAVLVAVAVLTIGYISFITFRENK